MELHGRKALVTGSARRIGKAIALGLARAGCDVAVHHAESDAEARKICREIESLGRKALNIKSDFQDPNAPFLVAEVIKEKFAALDILVNNASYYPEPEKVTASHSLAQETLETWDLALAVNARAPFFLIQALSPLLEKSSSANIINILDRSVSKPFLSRASHSVSKSALLAVTKLAAASLPATIRVNALELGAILAPDSLSESARSALNWGKVDEVVSAVIDVCSGKNTAQIIQIGPDDSSDR